MSLVINLGRSCPNKSSKNPPNANTHDHFHQMNSEEPLNVADIRRGVW